MAQFLIVRGDDLVHIGLQWSGFQLEHEAAAPGRRPRLVATSESARITLIFPPQVLSEPAMASAVLFALPTHRAGPSRVQFAVPAGTAMELTAEGVLKALTGAGVRVVSRILAPGDDPTAIEMPWKLIVTAVAESGGGVVSDHAILPVTSASGVTGLWHARLRASDGDTEDAGLGLLPLRALPGDMDPPTPLTEGARRTIVNQSLNWLPRARRLEISTLGGSLSATAKWPTFEWDHDVVLGRDQKIRVLTTGALYPFGHRAQLTMLTERMFLTLRPASEPPRPPRPTKWTCPNHPNIVRPRPGLCPIDSEELVPQGPEEPPDPPPDPLPPRSFAAAGLNERFMLVITEPVRGVAHGVLPARDFPFHEIEILTRTFTDIGHTASDPFGPFFIPLDAGGRPLRFPVRCAGANGNVFFDVPLVFVRDFSPEQAPAIAAIWEPHSRIALPGVFIDMIRSAPQREGDVHEVHEINIAGVGHGGGFRPKLSQFTAEIPALRTLLRKPVARVALKFSDAFLTAGDSVDLALSPVNAPVEIDFTERPDRSGGLMAPKFKADAFSRTFGPIPAAALPGAGVPLSSIYEGATLLGLPLGSVIKDDGRQGPPTIIPAPGNPPGAKMVWELRLQNHGPFRANNSTKATLMVESSPSNTVTTCTIENFDFVLPSTGEAIVTLKFGSLAFTQKPGLAPELAVNGLEIVFGGALELVKTLTEKLRPLLGGSKPTISATPSGITADYALAVPSVDAGMFLMRNVAINFGVDVPFSRNPVTVSLGFARRDNPFNLSVSMFGGGGYIDIQMGQAGITRLEAVMEFGAMVAVNFIVASAEVHALGGVRFLTVGGTIVLDAFIRIGGSVEVLGLVSVSIELIVTLTYDPPPLNRLFGRATLVIEVDLTLFSESVTIDSGEWELIGAGGARILALSALHISDVDAGLAGLLAYEEAFAT